MVMVICIEFAVYTVQMVELHGKNNEQQFDTNSHAAVMHRHLICLA